MEWTQFIMELLGGVVGICIGVEIILGVSAYLFVKEGLNPIKEGFGDKDKEGGE